MAIKEESKLKENQRKREQIKQAIADRCEYLRTDQRRLVNVLTNRFREKIVIDRLKIPDPEGDNYLTTDPTTIQTKVEEYYKNAFKKRKIGRAHV